MRQFTSPARKIFLVCLVLFFAALCIVCLVPFLHILALSFSHKLPAMQRMVTLLPLDFNELTKETFVGLNFSSYQFVLEREEFTRAFAISVERVLLGGILTLAVVTLTAYPLSKGKRDFTGRTVYAWFIIVTMFVAGGLVPWYLTVKNFGMLNTMWALVLPGCAPPFMIVLMLNFFRSIPKPLEESAYLDGCGHFRIFLSIYLPLSLPSIATVTLFIVVANWNAWFDGMIFMSSPRNYPLQSYLQSLIDSTSTMMMSRGRAELLKNISDRTVKAAQIFVGALPMLVLYPFLQRYFMMGMTLGSVKE